MPGRGRGVLGQCGEHLQPLLFLRFEFQHVGRTPLHPVAADDVHTIAEPELLEPGQRTSRQRGDVDAVVLGEPVHGVSGAVEQRRVVGVVDQRGEDAVDVEAHEHRSGRPRHECRQGRCVVVVRHRTGAVRIRRER